MKIEFFVEVEHRLQFACRLIRKARGSGSTVLACCRDADRLARFDTALWTFSALDFLPHVYAHSPLATVTPIILAADLGAAPERDVLLVLDDEVVPGFERDFVRYGRVLEVVSRDETDRAAARNRWRTYKSGGFEPVKIELGETAGAKAS